MTTKQMHHRWLRTKRHLRSISDNPTRHVRSTPPPWPPTTARPGGIFVAPTPSLPEPFPVWRAARLDLSDITWIPSAAAIPVQAGTTR